MGNKSGIRQFGKLFGAHFKMTFREKQVWFWSIFYPVLLLVIFLLIFGRTGSDDFSARIAVVEGASAPAAAGVKEALGYVDVLEQTEEKPANLDEARQWLIDKEVDAVVALPEAGGEIKLLLNKEKQNSVTAQAVSGILNQLVVQSSLAAAGVEPQLTIATEYVSAGSDKLSYTDFLMTGMIALAISQSGLFGMMGMVEMRRNGLLKRLFLAPVDLRMFGLSSMAVRFLLSLIQVALLTLIGVLFFGAHLNVDPLGFALVFLVGTLSFAGMGFLIAAVSKSMDSYMGIANLASFLMMFLSGIFFDLGSLPEYIRPISHVLPLTYFADGLRDAMVYGFGIGSGNFWLNLGIMAVWGLTAFLIGSRLYKWNKA